MGKNIALGIISALAIGVTGTAALAQSEEAMSVYVGNLPDIQFSGDAEAIVEVPLEVAAEACGVDLKFIEAWAQSQPRYCVALHQTEVLDESIEEQLGSN